MAVALIKRREPRIVALGQAKLDWIIGVRQFVHGGAHLLKAGKAVFLRDMVFGLIEFARARLREHAPRLVFRLLQHLTIFDEKACKQRAQKGGHLVAQLFQIIQAIIVH